MIFLPYRFLPPLGKLEKILEKLNIERGEKMNRTKLAERDKNELKGDCTYGLAHNYDTILSDILLLY